MTDLFNEIEKLKDVLTKYQKLYIDDIIEAEKKFNDSLQDIVDNKIAVIEVVDKEEQISIISEIKNVITDKLSKNIDYYDYIKTFSNEIESISNVINTIYKKLQDNDFKIDQDKIETFVEKTINSCKKDFHSNAYEKEILELKEEIKTIKNNETNNVKKIQNEIDSIRTLIESKHDNGDKNREIQAEQNNLKELYNSLEKKIEEQHDNDKNQFDDLNREILNVQNGFNDIKNVIDSYNEIEKELKEIKEKTENFENKKDSDFIKNRITELENVLNKKDDKDKKILLLCTLLRNETKRIEKSANYKNDFFVKKMSNINNKQSLIIRKVNYILKYIRKRKGK